ncbi:MAG: leucyl aminopeptidase [Candidatus Margulisiibacteriota bacterium]
MKIKYENESILNVKCDLLVVNEFEGIKRPGGATGAVNKALNEIISKLMEDKEIDGKAGKTTIIHTYGKLPADKVLVVGLGKSTEFGLEEARKAASSAIKAAMSVKAKKVATIVHGAGIGGLVPSEAGQALIEGSILGQYKFHGYKTPSSEEDAFKVQELIVVDRDKDKIKEIEKGGRVGEVIARAQNRVRDAVNSPSNKRTPTTIAEHARQLAKKSGLKCEVLDPLKAKMGAIWAIAKGSKEPPKVVILKYNGAGANAETIAIIGKGITFDSGGINIKPSKNLWEMKTDMAGAAAVIETMGILKELKIKKNVLAVIPNCENMPGGASVKPGDVITSLSGKTIEVINTDAEGRVILSDAITYAKKAGVKEIIDIATLTGGCVIALGDTASGIFTNNKDMLKRFMVAAMKTGEKYWELPIYDEFKDLMKSDIADIKNSSETGKASASTGAVFLQEFVGDTPWIHIDIAGTAFLSKGTGCLGDGATGVTLRTLIQYLMN